MLQRRNEELISAGEPAGALSRRLFLNRGFGVTAVAGLTGGALMPADTEAAQAVGDGVTGVYALESYGAIDLTGATDATSVLTAALNDMYANGGGTLVFPAGSILIAGQVVLPSGNPIANGASLQPTYIWQGQGGYCTGQRQEPTSESGGTRLLLTFQGATYNEAKIVTRGLGSFSLRDFIFHDTTPGSATPFLFTTNTTLFPENCAFIGARDTRAELCQQDAIVLGGTRKPRPGEGWGGADSAFQGYGTIVEKCYFNNVRRIVYGRSYCNNVVIRDNFADKGTGSNLANGACVEFDGGLDSSAPGNKNTLDIVTGNYFEWTGGYTYQVLLRDCAHCVVAFNGGVDPGPNQVSLVRCEGVTIDGRDYPSAHNRVIANFTQNGIVLSEDEMSAGSNEILGAVGGSVFAGQLTVGNRCRIIKNGRPGFEFLATSGEVLAAWRTGSGTPEGVIDAPRGSLYTSTSGGVGATLYVKESGDGSTGWVAK